MNLNTRQPAILGLFFIVLGLVWWLELWALLIPAGLLVGGIHVYRQRKGIGRTQEAVQAGVLLVGMGLLWLIDFVWPGILFLAGACLLMRGREVQFDGWLQRVVGYGRQAAMQVSRRPQRGESIPSQQVPIVHHHIATTVPPQPQRIHGSVTGETTQLQ